MLERILVPLDGSKTAESVLPYVRELGFRAKSDLTLFHVIDPEVPLNSPRYSVYMRRATQSAKRKAEDYLRGVADDLQNARIQTNVRTIVGPAAQRILSAAESQRSGLVIISSRGRGEGDGWPYGSIADRILHHARVPVLLVKPRPPLEQTEPAFQTLVVPLDGSRVAEAVIPLARELATKLGLGLHLIQAVPTPWQARAVLGWDVTENEEVREVDPVKDGHSYLDSVAQGLTQDRIWAEGRVLVGAAVPSILGFAKGKEGTLIIMCTAGSRGIGAGWRVGSVAERIIRHSETPVLLVPPRLAPHLRIAQRYAAATPALATGISS